MKKIKVAVLLLCALMLLTFTSCDSIKYGLEDSDVVKPSEYGYRALASFDGDGMLTFSPSADGYVFELYARDGSFRTTVQKEGSDNPLDRETKYVESLVIEGSGFAVWTNIENTTSNSYFEGDKTYIEVLIKKDGQYVGYAVAEVKEREGSQFNYLANILECKETTVENAREKGLTKDKLQGMINDIIRN